MFMSDLGGFSRAILESDPESGSRAKWLRGKSLAIALAIEATLFAALLLAPLLAPGVLPPVLVFTPAPPYRGEPRPVAHSSPPANPRDRTIDFNAVADRPVSRPIAQHAVEAPPMLGTVIGDRTAPAGPGIPGGADRGTVVALAPPPSAPHDRPLAQSEGVMSARLERRAQPDYPQAAKWMHLSGMVRLRAVIGTDGSVQQLRVLSGNPILAQAAVAAVRQWRYQPTRLNGQPVEVLTNITVTFVLN
jgi:periplasmic protein TonB